MRFGDIFCGCGGLSLGFKKAGFIPVFGIDSDLYACKVYAENIRPEMIISRDIRESDPFVLPKIDILLGCPPCQGFSKINGNGRRNKRKDQRNDLIKIFTSYVCILKPRIFLFENVPQLRKDFRFTIMIRELTRDYVMAIKILDLGFYGGGDWFPERPAVHRRRIVVIGVRRDISKNPDLFIPDPTGSPIPIGNILNKVKKTKEIKKYRRLGRKLSELAGYLRPGMSRDDLPMEIKKRYFYPCWLKRKNAFTDVFMRIDPDKPLPYISSGFLDPDRGPFLHPFENRGYSIEEISAAMSFPDDFKLNVPMRKAAELLGNAFPPQAAYAFALKFLNLFRGYA